MNPECVKSIQVSNKASDRDVSESINSLAVLSANRLAVTAGKNIQIWNTDSWKLINTFSHFANVTCAISTMDGKLLSSSQDRTIKLWNCSTGTLEKTFLRHTSCVWSLCSLSKDIFASGSHDGDIYIWSISCGYMGSLQGKNKGLHSVNSLAALLSQGYIVSGTNDGNVRIWTECDPLPKSSKCRVLRGAEHGNMPIQSVVFLSNGKLASCSENEIRIWEGRSLNSSPVALPAKVEPLTDYSSTGAVESPQIQFPDYKWKELIFTHDQYLSNILEWLKCAPSSEYSIQQLLHMPTEQSEQATLGILFQLVEKVKECHSRSQRCDLRPWNVVVYDSNQILLKFSQGIDGGTPDMAHVDGTDTMMLHQTCDVYSLGILFVQCLLENDVDVFAVVRVPELSESGLLKGWLRDLCARMLCEDRLRRPSVDEIYCLFADGMENNRVYFSTRVDVGECRELEAPSKSICLHG